MVGDCQIGGMDYGNENIGWCVKQQQINGEIGNGGWWPVDNGWMGLGKQK